MNQKSFAINFFLKLFVVENIKAKKREKYMSASLVFRN